jgi:hypothetical protein
MINLVSSTFHFSEKNENFLYLPSSTSSKNSRDGNVPLLPYPRIEPKPPEEDTVFIELLLVAVLKRLVVLLEKCGCGSCWLPLLEPAGLIKSCCGGLTEVIESGDPPELNFFLASIICAMVCQVDNALFFLYLFIIIFLRQNGGGRAGRSRRSNRAGQRRAIVLER